MTKREYVPEQREAALSLYPEYGPSETGRRLGIPAQTISHWANSAGVRMNEPPVAKVAANAAKRVSLEERRLAVAENLITRAERLVERLSEGEVAHKGQQAREVSYVEITPESAEKLAKAIAGLVQTSNLLTGGATARTETLNRSDKETKLARILSIAQTD